MIDSVLKYASWIDENQFLARDTTLFLRVSGLCEINRDLGVSPWIKTLVFPNGLLPSNRFQISEFPGLLDKLSRPYSELLEKAIDLPSEDIDSDLFYDICDTFWEKQLHIPEYQPPCQISDEGVFQFLPPTIPTRYFKDCLALELSVAYAHAVLKDIDRDKKRQVFIYKSGDQRIFPSLRWTDLVERDILNQAELKNLKENLERLNARILQTMDGEPKDRNPAVNDPCAYAHCLKNTPHDTDVLIINQKLGIRYVSPRMRRMHDQKKEFKL